MNKFTRLFSGKQDAGKAESAPGIYGEPGQGGLKKTSLSTFMYRLWDGTRFLGGSTMMIMTIGLKYPAQNNEMAYTRPNTAIDMSQYLPSKTHEISVQKVFNEQTREYDTHMRVNTASAGAVFEFIFDQLTGFFADKPLASVPATAAAIGAGILFHRLKKIKKDGAGVTFEFRGNVDDLVKAVQEQDYAQIQNETNKVKHNEVNTKVNEKFKETKGEIEKVVGDTKFEAGQFPKFKNMSDQEIYNTVETRFNRIMNKLKTIDPDFKVELTLEGSGIKGLVANKSIGSNIVGATQAASASVSDVVEQMNRYIESQVGDLLNTVKKNITQTEMKAGGFVKVKSGAIQEYLGAKSGEIGQKFMEYVDRAGMEKGVQPGGKLILVQEELAPIAANVMYDVVPKNQRGGLTKQNFLDYAKEGGLELGSHTFERPPEAKMGKWGQIGKALGGGKLKSIGLGLVVGALVYAGTNWMFYGSENSKKLSDLNHVTFNGVALSPEDLKTLKLPGGEVKIGDLVRKNIKNEKTGEYEVHDYKINYKDLYTEVAPHAKKRWRNAGALPGEDFYANPIPNGSFVKDGLKEFTWTVQKAPPKWERKADPKTGKQEVVAFNSVFVGPQSTTPDVPKMENFGNGLFEIGFEDGNIIFGRHVNTPPEIIGTYKDWTQYTVHWAVDIPNDAYGVQVLDAFGGVVAQKAGRISETAAGSTFMANAQLFQMMEGAYVKGKEVREDLGKVEMPE